MVAILIQYKTNAYDDDDALLSLKVRISLPPSRAAPKRTAAERKSIVDEPLSDDDDNDSTGDKKKSPSGKRGRPKKGGSPKGKSAKGGKTTKEYEVQKIIDDEMRSGKKYYRIRWKGWGAKDDTWEPKGTFHSYHSLK